MPTVRIPAQDVEVVDDAAASALLNHLDDGGVDATLVPVAVVQTIVLTRTLGVGDLSMVDLRATLAADQMVRPISVVGAVAHSGWSLSLVYDTGTEAPAELPLLAAPADAAQLPEAPAPVAALQVAE